MQRPAAKSARRAASTASRLVALWVPGKELVDIGVDELSRSGVAELHDIQLSAKALLTASSLAEAYLGGRPTIDWFASRATAQLPRFWSRHWQPGAEGVDAFLSHSWAASSCACGESHQEIGLFFPPFPLLSRVWARIKQEGALGVIIVPRTPGEPWWPLLEEASLASVEIPDPFLHSGPRSDIYTSRRMTWHAHAFAFGLRIVPDQCVLFRQDGKKPPFPAQRHTDMIRSSSLAPAMAAMATRPTPS
jgi:hypothetical protein